MSVLENKRCYLSGPIENDDGKGNWRTEPIKVLKERFGLNVFDPFADPKQQWWVQIKEAKETKNYEKMRAIAKSFVRKDLSLIDRSDLVIAHIKHGIPSWGTSHEIINSNAAKKPTLIVSDVSKEMIPLWLWGFIPPEFMFNNWDELYHYLDEVNDGLHKDNNRFAFIYGLV